MHNLLFELLVYTYSLLSAEWEPAATGESMCLKFLFLFMFLSIADQKNEADVTYKEKV